MTTPVERRGDIRIPDRVLTRIATRAAEEVDGVVAVRRRGTARWKNDARATVAGDLAVVSLNVTVTYPTPIRTLTERLRRHVADRVHQLTGLTVDHVDIDVTALVPKQRSEHEVEERS